MELSIIIFKSVIAYDKGQFRKVYSTQATMVILWPCGVTEHHIENASGF